MKRGKKWKQKFFLVYFMCIGILSAYGIVVTDSCELPCGRQESNLGPLEEQSMLLTAESSLQPEIFVSYVAIFFSISFRITGRLSVSFNLCPFFKKIHVQFCSIQWTVELCKEVCFCGMIKGIQGGAGVSSVLDVLNILTQGPEQHSSKRK